MSAPVHGPVCPWEPGIYRWHPTARRWQWWHEGTRLVRAGWSDTGGPGDRDEHGGPLEPAHAVYYGVPRVVPWEGEATPPPPEPRPATVPPAPAVCPTCGVPPAVVRFYETHAVTPAELRYLFTLRGLTEAQRAQVYRLGEVLAGQAAAVSSPDAGGASPGGTSR